MVDEGPAPSGIFNIKYGKGVSQQLFRRHSPGRPAERENTRKKFGGLIDKYKSIRR